jgi:hypothetical protein
LVGIVRSLAKATELVSYAFCSTSLIFEVFSSFPDLKFQDQKLVGLVQQQGGSVPSAKKLQLPLPLAVRNSAPELYKQSEDIAQGNNADTIIDSQKVAEQQNGADVNEAKVMRRDILDTNQYGGEVNSGLNTAIKDEHRDILSDTVSKDKLSGGKNASLERQKRDALTEESGTDTLLVASIMNKEKNEHNVSNVIQGDALENCAVGEKVNAVSGAETLKMVTLSKGKYITEDQKDEAAPSVSDKYIAPSQILALGTAPDAERMADIIESASEHSHVSETDASSTGTNISGNQKHEGLVSAETKTQADSKDEAVIGLGDVSTSSPIIKTPSHLSEPRLNDEEMKMLNEAVINAKDILVVAKPMTRDLKSVPAVQKVYENNEHNETNYT